MKQFGKYIFTLILLFTCIYGGAQSQKPAKRLSVSKNRRFLVDEKGAPFFWLGDTGWLLFSKLTREEAERYLEDRRQKGFNVIQVMVLHTVAAANVYGDSALIGRSVARPLVTKGASADDSLAYDYWDHVDHIVDLAARKGMYMAMVPVWGSNVKSGWVSREEAVSYGSWLAERYQNRWNIIWLNGGDIRGSDSLQTWKLLGSTLKKKDPGHLVTFHPFGRTTSSQWFHHEPWLDFNMFQSGHRSYDLDTSKSEHRFGPDNYKFQLIDYALRPVKPSLDGEPSYELIPHGLHDTTKTYWQAQDMRRYAYWSVFAGSFGHTYGHNSVMQMHKPSDKGSAYGSKKYWDAALNDSGARQMIHLKQLILARSYFDRVPDQSLLGGEAGSGYRYIAATRGKDYALFYNYTGRDFNVYLESFPASRLRAYWFNPRTGMASLAGSYPAAPVIAFNPPGEEREGNDWVLILEKIQ